MSNNEDIDSQNNGEVLVEDSPIVFSQTERMLSCIGQQYIELPSDVIARYAPLAQKIDLSFNCINSMLDFEAFVDLEELVLDNNDINDDVEIPLLPKLHTLMLNKNSITSLEDLIEKMKVSLPSLTYISLLGNSACPNLLSCIDKDDDDYQRYRYKLIHHIPQLKFIDAAPVKEQERLAAKKMGAFLTVVRPAEDTSRSGEFKESPSSKYTPLPETTTEKQGPTGTFGVSKYVYFGKHSEGNRFIRNTDL